MIIALSASMKIYVFTPFCILFLPLILFCQLGFGQTKSLPEADVVYYRVVHYSFNEDADLGKLGLAFDELNSSASSVKCASLVSNQSLLRVICLPEISPDQIILYGQKKGFDLVSISNQLLGKGEVELGKFFLECKGVSEKAQRKISRANFDRLPELKQAHISSHPELYIVE